MVHLRVGYLPWESHLRVRLRVFGLLRPSSGSTYRAANLMPSSFSGLKESGKAVSLRNIYIFLSASICKSISIYLFTATCDLHLYPYICLSTYLSIYRSSYLTICLSVCLSVCLLSTGLAIQRFSHVESSQLASSLYSDISKFDSKPLSQH